MTKFSQELRQCPLCLNEENAIIWQVIDPAEDPDLRDKLLRKQLQVFTCSICGQAYHLIEPLIYIDKNLEFLLYFTPTLNELGIDGSCQSFKNLPPEVTLDLPKPQELSYDNFSAWRLRLCPDMNTMLEKIHIFEAGFDDRIMEVVKLAVEARLLNDEQKVVEELHFLAADSQEMLFVVQYAGKSKNSALNSEPITDETENFLENFEQLALGLDLYNNASKLLSSSLPQEQNWSIIDQAFALNLINREN